MMKKVFLISLIVFCTGLISSAQYDEKFYFPSKELQSLEGLVFNEYCFKIDNDSLHAILLNPETKAKATVIYYHGAGGNITTYTKLIIPLVKSGFQVFMIDFRGYGKSTGKPTHLNIASDAQIIFDEIIQKDEFKSLPILIYGASMGTQIATKIAKDNQSNISGLILDGTISSFTDMALLSVPEEQHETIVQFVTSPYSAKSDIREINGMPKLLIHSKGDKSVPFTQGELVYNNANEPKEFWEFEGEHLESAIKYPDLLIQKLLLLMD